MRTESRKGFEFSKHVKELAKERAYGMCEHPLGCPHRNNGIVDHVLAISIGKRVGREKQYLKSLDNAQLLCDEHDRIKQLRERWILRQLDAGRPVHILNRYDL